MHLARLCIFFTSNMKYYGTILGWYFLSVFLSLLNVSIFAVMIELNANSAIMEYDLVTVFKVIKVVNIACDIVLFRRLCVIIDQTARRRTSQDRTYI